MCRGFLHVLSAVCCTALLVAAAPPQSAGGDRLVRAKGGEYTIELPAAWKIMLQENGVEAAGDRVRMKVFFVAMVGSLRYSIGGLVEGSTKNWKDVTAERDDSTTIGGNGAEIAIIHGVNEAGVRAVHRAALVNPMPSDPGHHTYAFLFDVAESDYARSLPLIQRIEQSFRVGTAQPATLPPATKKAAPAFSDTVFRDPKGLFNVTIPDDWTAESWRLGVMFKHGKALINLTTHSEKIEPEVMARIQVKLATEGWKDVRSSGASAGTIAGNPAATIAVLGNTASGASFYRFTCFNLGQQTYIFRTSAPPPEYPALQSVIERIEQSFRAGTAQPATLPPAAKKAAPPPAPAPVMPPPLPEPEPAGAAASTYRDPQGRFQIPVPPGWTADQAGDGARISRGSSYANVLVAGGASSPSALVQQIAQQVGTQWKNFQMVQNGQWNLGGLPAEFGVYTGTNPKGSPALLRIVATSGFVLLMSVPQSDWEALKADLRQIESGFSTGRAPAGRASLGVACHDVNSGEMWGAGGATIQGAVIEEIGPGSPAEKAGFRIGDTIISVDRQAVKGVKDLARLVAAHRPGDTVEIVVLRGGKPLEFMVTLAGRP